jgi:hypothetical protein
VGGLSKKLQPTLSSISLARLLTSALPSKLFPTTPRPYRVAQRPRLPTLVFYPVAQTLAHDFVAVVQPAFCGAVLEDPQLRISLLYLRRGLAFARHLQTDSRNGAVQHVARVKTTDRPGRTSLALTPKPGRLLLATFASRLMVMRGGRQHLSPTLGRNGPP